MIHNATITATIAPGPTAPSGERTWASPTPRNCRCLMQGATFAQMQLIGGMQQSRAAAIYLDDAQLRGDPPPGDGWRIVAQADDGSASTWVILKLIRHLKGGGLSHFELLLLAV